MESYEEQRQRKEEERRRKRQEARRKRQRGKVQTGDGDGDDDHNENGNEHDDNRHKRDKSAGNDDNGNKDGMGMRRKRERPASLSSSSSSTSSSMSISSPTSPDVVNLRKRDRIEKLKEEKRAEEGLKLIQERYGHKYNENEPTFARSSSSDLEHHPNDRCSSRRGGGGAGANRRPRPRPRKNSCGGGDDDGHDHGDKDQMILSPLTQSPLSLKDNNTMMMLSQSPSLRQHESNGQSNNSQLSVSFKEAKKDDFFGKEDPSALPSSFSASTSHRRRNYTSESRHHHRQTTDLGRGHKKENSGGGGVYGSGWSEDDDNEEFFQFSQTLPEQASQSHSQRYKFKSFPTVKAAKKISKKVDAQTLKLFDDDDDDDDYDGGGVGFNVSPKSYEEKEKYKESNDDDDNEDFLAYSRQRDQARARARKEEQKETREMQSPPPKSSHTDGDSDNNDDGDAEVDVDVDGDVDTYVPMATTQENDGNRLNVRNVSSPTSSSSLRRNIHDTDEDFWMDDNEINRLTQQQQTTSTSFSSPKKKRRGGGASAENVDVDVNDNNATTNGTSNRRRGRRLKSGKEKKKNGKEKERSGYNDNDFDSSESETDAQLEQCLKPEFDDPKWPPTELEPFPLHRVNLCGGPVDNDGEAGTGTGTGGIIDYIPASMSRYVQDYQKEGVQFLHKNVTIGEGAVLGDDMGLGKTVQLIALVAALQKKTGTKKDLKEIKVRRRLIDNEIQKQRENSKDEFMWGSESHASVDISELQLPPRPPFSPILIIVPPSVLTNWENEFKTWGHFAVGSYSADSDKAVALHRILIGKDDILLCPKSALINDSNLNSLLTVPWQLIVIDEFHEYKRQTTKSYKALESLRNTSRGPLIGLTGTLMSNDHKELWTLIDLVQKDILGEWKEFQTDYSKPIMLARTKDAKPDVLELSDKRSDELNEILQDVFLRRDKNITLEDFLPTKNQKVVFCELTAIQKQLYQHIIDLPEYDLMRKSNTPCDCGVNKRFFQNYKLLTTKKQKIDFYRRHKGEIVKRKDCCYKSPKSDLAVIWNAQHSDGVECERCPNCIFFAALQKLYKICSHAALIQAGKHPDSAQGEKEKEELQKVYDFAKVAIPDDILPKMPGKSYIRQSSILLDHTALSGKMKILKKYLKRFERSGDRVLLFSTSTQTLDFIQEFVKERGYTHLRLDGSTPARKRQGLVDKFQKERDIFLFLISTKAGGMGLNLTAANRVIIYDVNWNPAHDEQAQDRAFRIGQKNDVDVIRLVAEGTIEELQYMRQVYKIHLKQQTLKSDDYTSIQPARIFRGVDKDKNRKGELFGIENLLKFKDGSFMADQWKATEVQSNETFSPGETHKVTDLPVPHLESENDVDKAFEDEAGILSQIEYDANDRDVDGEESQGVSKMKGFQHEDFLRGDRGDAALQHGDVGYDEEIGGESQMVHLALGQALDDIDSSSEDGDKRKMKPDRKNNDMVADELSFSGKAAEEALLLDLESAIKMSGSTNLIHQQRPQESLTERDPNDIGSMRLKSTSPRKKVPSPKQGGRTQKRKPSKSNNGTKSSVFGKKTSSFDAKKLLYVPSYLRGNK